MTQDLAASIRAKLLNIAKADNTDFNQILVRYALERLLYRISRSEYSNQFLLKGALLFTLWYDMPHRPTRDADLLGFGNSDLRSIENVFREISSIQADDGISFDPSSVVVEEIRKEAGYTGARVLITAELAKARSKTQIDIGFGDAVTPHSVDAIYPTLIRDMPAPHLRVYPIYTVAAEKLHAITLLGMTNTRLKDYFDLQVLFDREQFDMQTLAEAISATFTRRGMPVPTKVPVGLTDEFSEDPTRQRLWFAFLRKNDLKPTPLSETVAHIRSLLTNAIHIK
ncbi:MAG: nucleotidyl transferase AbiEii/AbiGii toxin family protein [Methylotenera sp.]|jgi:predicted nucleotidyltransferase component of viral defense system|nr:nucleotidyl transferase AbiEii/AbiGii toxin family protein [Methylococcaceae bacterium]MDP3678690.1 nucleotidyl transferase AbiEii/AbiGii toxin family protein [Methylotenera sp.]